MNYINCNYWRFVTILQIIKIYRAALTRSWNKIELANLIEVWWTERVVISDFDHILYHWVRFDLIRGKRNEDNIKLGVGIKVSHPRIRRQICHCRSSPRENFIILPAMHQRRYSPIYTPRYRIIAFVKTLQRCRLIKFDTEYLEFLVSSILTGAVLHATDTHLCTIK